MKYSARLNKVNNINHFDEVILYFAEKFLKVNDIDEGENWLYAFGDYIQKSDFPCTKININPFSGYSDRFNLTLYYNDTQIVWLQIKVLPFHLMKVYNYTYEKKDFEMFHNIITDYFTKLNNEEWNTMLNVCKINEDNNEITVTDHHDYKPNGKTEILKGTLEQIFEQYTTHNDRLRYCNGMYWRFQSPQVSTLYTMFIELYDGNYFLDNAVKRGVTID